MNIESTLSNIIFFPSIRNGKYLFNTQINSSLIRFEKDKSIEPSQFLFEYLCYKIIRNKVEEGQFNNETVLITENFFLIPNCKDFFIEKNAIHKKNIVIFLQNQNTLKWNVIIFIDLEEQLKNCFDNEKKQPIIAKIIEA